MKIGFSHSLVHMTIVVEEMRNRKLCKHKPDLHIPDTYVYDILIQICILRLFALCK